MARFSATKGSSLLLAYYEISTIRKGIKAQRAKRKAGVPAQAGEPAGEV